MFRILVGFFCFLCNAIASEYIFTYRIAVKNGIILNEKYHFSPSMVSSNLLNKTKSTYRKCEIPHEAKSEKEFMNDYKANILDCFLKWGVRLEDRSEVRNLKGSSVTFLSIPPTRIKIEYASGIATFYALVENTKKASFLESLSLRKQDKTHSNQPLEDLESQVKESEDEVSHR